MEKAFCEPCEPCDPSDESALKECHKSCDIIELV